MHKRFQKLTSSKWLRRLLPAVLIIVWITLAGIGGPYFGKIDEVSSNDLTAFLPSNAESTKVNDELAKFRDSNTLPLLVVFDKGGEKLSEADKTALKDAAAKIQDIDGVVDDVSPPLISEDGKAAFIAVPLEVGGEFKEIFAEIKGDLDGTNLATDYKFTGPASFAEDIQGAFAGIDGTLLLVALAVVFVILLVVYRSPLLPVIVLVGAMSALATAILLVWHLAKADVLQLNGQVQGILFILVIGATTDYALLYIARYKEELTRHKTAWQATVAALRASFEPILAAGGTVAAGLLCLLLSDLESNKALGPVGGIGIGLAVITSLTFLPSLLLVFGRSVFWPRRPKYEPELRNDYEHRHSLWVKVGSLVHRHPRRIWAGTAGLLLLACVGIFQLKADGVPQNQLILGYSEAREGQKVLDAHFASGSGSPVYVLVNEGELKKTAYKLDMNKGIDSVSVTATDTPSGSAPVGVTERELKATIKKQVTAERAKQVAAVKAQITKQMAGLPQPVIDQAVKAAMTKIPSVDTIAASAYPFKNAKNKVIDGKVLLQATLVDQADSLAARETVKQLRADFKEVGSSALVGGVSAVQYDTNQASLRDRALLIPVILVVITIILMLLLRAIIAPLVLLLTTVVSFAATLGIAALLFNNVLGFPGADPSVVIFGFVFLVALGIDYNIFLMTRVREETIKWGVSKGTIKGLVVTGGVITSAGIVLAATFAALGVIPILFLAQLAFIVAFGVLLDTIVVRSLLVPALTLEIGKWMWWPSKAGKKK
ncbi:MAG: MMPL family transporter [Candidatus Saccharibacteria bacterium]|nr:MAG: MMPL family transporter [Candidatus Saccharibacteria bacterium]